MFPTSSPRTSRLTSPFAVEVLESRDVPAAAFYWNPLFAGGMVNTSVDVASNWTDVSGVRQTAAPGSADDLYFSGSSRPGSSGPSYPTADAVIKSASSSQSVVRTYNGVHLLAGYTGTVDFQVSSFVGVLELRSGKIAQNDAFFTTMGGGQLSVTQSMTWTGGAFNSGKIDPSTGVYVPPPAGKLNLLGNTVSVFDPARRTSSRWVRS